MYCLKQVYQKQGYWKNRIKLRPLNYLIATRGEVYAANHLILVCSLPMFKSIFAGMCLPDRLIVIIFICTDT